MIFLRRRIEPAGDASSDRPPFAGPRLPAAKDALRETLRRAMKALHLLGNRKYRHGLAKGVAAAIEHRNILRALRLKTVVDVGANVGQFSLLAWTLHPEAWIFAFEPLPQAAQKFLEVLPRGAPVTLFQSAIGSTSGRAEMHVARKNDSSSLLPMTPLLAETFPDTDEIARAEVPVNRLDAFIGPDEIRDPALLKLDVQGAELDVLKGCESLLDRFRYIYVELSFLQLYAGQPLAHHVIAHLERQGFELAGVNNLVFNRHEIPVQADFFFVRADVPDSERTWVSYRGVS